MIAQTEAKVLKNSEVGPGYHAMVLECPSLAARALPGQFVEIKTSYGDQPLLRRPFGVHRVSRGGIEILYEVLGEGTRSLSMRKEGEYLEVIGPLGNGFQLRRELHAILVAGGMGVAPLIFLAEKLMEGKRQKSKGKILVLIGAKTRNHILCEKDFKRLGCEVKISTDDGSRGFRGYVCALLKQEFRVACSQSRALYACGPSPMLQEVGKIAADHALPCQVSLEAHMACGFGACLGCVVRIRPHSKAHGEFEYQRVCKEGPVFEASQVIWGKEY